MKSSVYQIVTDIIMSKLEEGVVPWTKPWISVNTGGAYNFKSGKSYSLMNQMLLMEHGPGAYGSYRQWQQAGGFVKKGEKGNLVIFWKWPDDREADCEDEENRKEWNGPILKYYFVFHQSQVEGVDIEERTQSSLFDTEPIEAAENVIRNYVNRENIVMDQGAYNEAYYSPAKDLVHIPLLCQYENPELYYSVAFHELTHSTSHPDRLNRPGFKNIGFGSRDYSKEELIAEIGSMQILHGLGMKTDETIRDSVAYINGWLRALKNDNRLVITAAGAAEKSTNFIFGTI